MKKSMSYIAVFAAILAVFIPPCHAQALSSTELILNAKKYDKKNVVFRGEVVGDIMARGEYAWLSVNDGPNAISVWATNDSAAQVQNIGGYQAKGDVIEVSGVFHRSCPEHGGDLDIHSQRLTKTYPGKMILRPVNKAKLYTAILLSFITISVCFLMRIRR